MRTLLLHHFLFLWLRAHLYLVFPICHAGRKVEVVCGDFSAFKTAKEMGSDILGGDFDVRLHHPAMLSDKIDLVEGMQYEVTFTGRNDVMEVQAVAVISTTDGAAPVPGHPSSLPQQYRCEIHPSHPFPPSPVQATSSVGLAQGDPWTFPSFDSAPEFGASDLEIRSTSSSSVSSSSGVPRLQTMSSSSDISTSPSSSSLLSSDSLNPTPLVLSSSLSSADTVLTSVSSSVSTPELVSSLPSERFSEHLPFSLLWTAEQVTSSCVTLTFVIMVNSSCWTQISRELCKPTGCKHYFTSETGIVHSPNFPAYYPDSSNCIYVIYTSTSSPIELQFQIFQLEHPYSEQCVDSVTLSNSHSVMQILCGEYDITQLSKLIYVTNDDTMVLHFISDNKISSQGFRALYTTLQNKECDMTHTRLNGTIRSPVRSSTGTYLPNMACNHSIILPQAYRIRFYLNHLNFSDLRTGACTDQDILHFRDLESQNEAKITCSDDVSVGDLVFESSGSRVEMLFSSDHVYEGDGFELLYVGVSSCHNETYNTSSGFVSSVNFPHAYPNMQECFYTVSVPPEKGGSDGDDVIIEVTFQKLHTESDSIGDARLRDELCSRDFVEISSGTQKHKVCGDWSRKEHLLLFRFRSSSVVFRFVSDEQKTRQGFNATWQTLRGDNKKSCLSTLVDAGHFSFQVIYHAQTWVDGEADCRSRGGHLATILSNNTQQLLTRHILNHSCVRADAYWIGGNDRQWESDFYWSDGSKVSFTNWFRGFPVQGSSVGRYGRQPSDDGQAKEDCVEMRRHFSLPEKGHIVTQAFFWNDRSCQEKNPYICQIKPRTVPPPVVQCDKNITLSIPHPEVRLHSPGYPHDLYPDHTNCSFFLHAPPSAILEIEFWDFQLENASATGRCEYDFVEISTNPVRGDKEAVGGRRCGDWSRKVKLLRQLVASFYVFVHFTADHSKRYRGFDVTVRMLQGPVDCWNRSGIVTSSGCVHVIPEQTSPQTDNCTSAISLWAPETDAGVKVILTHQLATAPQSSEDLLPEVTVFDRGRTEESCLKMSVSESETIDNLTVVTHVTKSRVSCSSAGLSLVCFRPAPNRTMAQQHWIDAVNQTEGQLHLPLSPDGHSYASDAAVAWTLQAPEDHRMLVMMSDVTVEGQDECLYDWVSVKNATPSQRICGQLEGALAVVSEENVAQVTFHSDYSVTGPAFNILWQSLNMSQCTSQTFTETSASFASFNFPRPFPDYIHCFVLITVEPDSRVLLHFSRIFFNDSSSRSIALDLSGLEQEEMGELMVGVEDGEEKGSLLKRVFVSFGNELQIRLEREALLVGEGFQASYRAVSKPYRLALDMTWLKPNTSSQFLSPNFPFHMPENLSFTYTLRAPIGYRIHVTFHHFRLPDAQVCSDTMEIDDVSLAGSEPRRLVQLCAGEESANDTDSELNKIKIVFRAGEKPAEERRRRSVAMDEDVIGFNISFFVYPDEAYLTKTSTIRDGTFDSCAESPCLHNGTCIESQDGARCTCPLHYTGLFCQGTWCQIPTCVHGDCHLIDDQPGFRCHCLPDHFGKQCQMNRTQCRKQVCHNAGDCFGNISHLHCTCDENKPEKTGPFCNVTSTDHMLNMTIGQRLLGEPIWIGLIVILIVLFLFGVVCIVRRRCAKHYACCQMQFKRKEPGSTSRGEGKRGGADGGAHPLATFNARRHLLRPPSSTAATPASVRAMPTISVTKADDDVTLPQPAKTTDELKAEVAARFFASYREAERAPISAPLPTDFSKTTDTFLTQTSEDPAVGAIVGGTLLLDLQRRKSREDLLSRWSLSIGPGNRRRSSSSSNKERIRRRNSTGPFLSRQQLPSVAGDLSAPKSPHKSRSLDDRDALSLYSDTVFPPSPPNFRSLSASPVLRHRLESQQSTSDFEGLRTGPGKEHKLGATGGEGPQHLFPEVIVHAGPAGRRWGCDTSDYSQGESPVKNAKSASSSRRDVRLKTEVDASRLAVDPESHPHRLFHSHSDSSLGMTDRDTAKDRARMLESRSETTLRFTDERPQTIQRTKSRRSVSEHDRTSRRNDTGQRVVARARDLFPDRPTALPLTHEPARDQSREQRHTLLHQSTVDSYLRQKSKHRRAHGTLDYYHRERGSGSMRRSSTSPVPFSENEYEVGELGLRHNKKKRASADYRPRQEADYEPRKRWASEHRHKPKPNHRPSQQLARDRRGIFKRNETVAVPSSSYTRRPRKRSGHARMTRKCSSVDVGDPSLHLPSRVRSEDMVGVCSCEECLWRNSSRHTSLSSRHWSRDGSESSHGRRYKTRASQEKPVRERRDVYRSHSPRSSDASWRTPRLTQTSGSSSSRAERELQSLKSSSSESESVMEALRGSARGVDSERLDVRPRGIEALGYSDKDLDISRRALFMKFFSQEVDFDDTLSPEAEPRFFLAPEPDSSECFVFQQNFIPAVKTGHDTDVQDRSSVGVGDSNLHVSSTSQFNNLEPRRKAGTLTSKCSVIMYDDDLRSHSSARSRSVSNNVSPKRISAPEKVDTRPDDNSLHPVVIQVEHTTPPLSATATITAGDNDSSSTSSDIVIPKNSDPSSLLSVTDTDSAVSSAASRQTSPCYDVVYTSSATTVTQLRVMPKARDSAYQTKESSVDMFDTGRDSRCRKSLPIAKLEDRKVTQRLHQAAVKLYLLQQRVRRARLSRDSAVSTISEDEVDLEAEVLASFGFQSRPWRSRKPMTLTEIRCADEAEEGEEERIKEEDEHESDLDFPRGLNPTPETLPTTAENVLEESQNSKECEA